MFSSALSCGYSDRSVQFLTLQNVFAMVLALSAAAAATARLLERCGPCLPVTHCTSDRQHLETSRPNRRVDFLPLTPRPITIVGVLPIPSWPASFLAASDAVFSSRVACRCSSTQRKAQYSRRHGRRRRPVVETGPSAVAPSTLTAGPSWRHQFRSSGTNSRSHCTTELLDIQHIGLLPIINPIFDD